MSRNYKFHHPVGVYFVSFAVIEWFDVFTRNEYKDILLENVEFRYIVLDGGSGDVAAQAAKIKKTLSD